MEAFALTPDAVEVAFRAYNDPARDGQPYAAWHTHGYPALNALEAGARDFAEASGLPWWEAVLVIVGTLQDRAREAELDPETMTLVSGRPRP